MRWYIALPALLALAAPVQAHDLGLWLAEDASLQGDAQYTVLIDGAPWKDGVVTVPQDNWATPPQNIWITLPDGRRRVTVVLKNSGPNLYVEYATYDNAAVVTSVAELQATGATFAFDVGQPPVTADTPPDPALYQGYGVHSLNSDFTAQLPIDWLGGCPNGMDGSRPTNFWTADPSPVWSLNLWWWFGNDTCDIDQVTDPKYGNQAIDLLWIVNHNNTLGTAIETTSPVGNNQVSFPNNAYWEIEYRIDPPADTADGVFVTWTAAGIVSQSGAGLELDIAEWVAGAPWASDVTTHNFRGGEQSSWWIVAPNALAWWITDPNHYHRFGMLTVTYNNDTAMYACSYFDRVLQACQTVPFSALDNLNRNILTLNNTCDWWNDSTCGGRDGQVQHMYVKHVDVWTRGD